MRRPPPSTPLRLLILTVACATCCALAGCYTPDAGRSKHAARATNHPVPRRLRVLTYNIHHAEGLDGRLDLERIARVVLDQQPDLVALQEVDVKTNRTGGVDQPAEFERLTGMHAAFGKAIDYQGGQYGQVILSRFPIENQKTHGLPGTPGVERRIALEVTVRPWANGPPVRFVSTHLDHRPAEGDRFRQAAEINRLFAGGGDAGDDATRDPEGEASPVILVGDFNAEPHGETMASVFQKWSDAAAQPPQGGTDPADALGPRQATYPSADPRKRIDYVLLRPTGGAWRVISTRVVPETVASDHSPVTSTLQWLGQ